MKLTPWLLIISWVSLVCYIVVSSRSLPGLTNACADSRTLKSFTLHTHQSRWTTLGMTVEFAARKASRSVMAGAVSYLAPPVKKLSLSVGVANNRLRLL